MSELEKYEKLAASNQEILIALKGNNELGHTGIVGQIKEIRDAQKLITENIAYDKQKVSDRIDSVQRTVEREKWFHRGMATATGAIAGLLASWFEHGSKG